MSHWMDECYITVVVVFVSTPSRQFVCQSVCLPACLCVCFPVKVLNLGNFFI